MKFSTTAFAFLGLLSSVHADEAAFRALEQRSNSLQLQALNASQSGCTSANIAVRQEWYFFLLPLFLHTPDSP